MTTADLIRELHAKRVSPGKWLARCPAHSDRRPSLQITEGRDGRTLLHCWAGCPTAAILEVAGLTWSDLFPEGHGNRQKLAVARAIRECAEQAAYWRKVRERREADAERERERARLIPQSLPATAVSWDVLYPPKVFHVEHF